MTPPATRRSGRSLLLRRGIPVLVLLLAVGAALFAVLGGGGTGRPARPAAAASSTAGSDLGPVGQDQASPTPTASPSPATEAAAPSVVKRPGVAASARTITAAPAAFTAPASWSDGASVQVIKAHQQTTSGTGPGAMAGQPQTLFTLQLANGSPAPLDVNTVVVQATYGSHGAQASPVYDDTTTDFAGTLAAGATATAVYSFAIPAGQLGDVTLSVDLDGRHFPAVFKGKVPAR